MANLIRTRPLAGLAAGQPAPTPTDHVGVAEMPYRALTNLRVEASAAGALTQVLALTLPIQANTVTEGQGGIRALWLGPDEWLVQNLTAEGADQVAQISTAMGEVHHSAKDVSDAYATIRLQGPKARAVLAKLTPFDIHPSVFTAGQCAQTVMAKSNVIMDMVEEGADRATFDITTRRSFATYLWNRMIDAGLEYGVAQVGAEPT